MKTSKEAIIFSGALSPEGRDIAKRLMKEDGLSIERLFNLLAQLQDDVAEIKRYVQHMDSAIDQAQYDINSHISSHD